MIKHPQSHAATVLALALLAGCTGTVTANVPGATTSASPTTAVTASSAPTTAPTTTPTTAATATPSTGATASPTTAPTATPSAAITNVAAANNFDFSTATAITTTSVVTGNSDTTHDNYFTITIPAGKQDGVLKLNLVENNQDWTPTITLYDNNKSELDSLTAPSDTTTPWASQEPVTAGSTYYFKLSNADSTTTAYTITPTFTPVPDVNERNDDFSTASPLTLGAATPFYLFAGFNTNGGNDADFFTFTVPTGSSKLNLSITDNSSDTNNARFDSPQELRYTLYDANKTEITDGTAANKQANVSTSLAITTGGVYYLKLDDAENANSINVDSLTVSAQ